MRKYYDIEARYPHQKVWMSLRREIARLDIAVSECRRLIHEEFSDARPVLVTRAAVRVTSRRKGKR